MSASPPTDREAIILEPSMICSEHQRVGQRWEIPFSNLLLATQGVCLESEAFFDIAYRLKNGYGRPEGVDWDDVPESERPGTEHINDVIREIEPLCCWVEEEISDPWPNEEGSPYLHIVADFAGREMADE